MNFSTIIKSLASPTGSTILGAAAGGALGGGLAEFEKAHDFYKTDATKGLASLTGVGGGALAGAILANPRLRANHMRLALGDIGALLGPKQILLAGTDAISSAANSVDDFTDIQNDLADKSINITKNQLDTAIANKEVADRANETSKEWLSIAKKYTPLVGGTLAALLGLYAYNSFKDKKQPIDLKIDQKLDSRNKGSMYLEIPSDKVSDKFYNQFSRELLFKDDREKYEQAKEKEKEGMNLTRKEKNIIEKFEKNASSSTFADIHPSNLTKEQQQFKDALKNEEWRINQLYDHENNLRTSLKDKYNKNLDIDDNLATSYLKFEAKLSPWQNAASAYKNMGNAGLTQFLEKDPTYSKLSPELKAQIFEHVVDVNTPFMQKLLAMFMQNVAPAFIGGQMPRKN